MIEVDALSYGRDHYPLDNPMVAEIFSFSVDEFATGGVTGGPPEVASEGAFGAGQASADVFVSFPPMPLIGVPAPPGAFAKANTQLFDGDGMPSPGGIILPLPGGPAPHGLGLLEPNPPTPAPGLGSLPDPGDNLDALDVDDAVGGLPPLFPIFYSLDAGFPDPLETPAPLGLGPVNSGSAAALGFSGGDILMTPGSGAPAVLYAPAGALGLDLFGFDTDDLDALVLSENGTGVFEPSVMPFAPFDWGPGKPADLVLFSVRRGSAVIGAPDSIHGVPITEGDILVPPFPGGGSPFPGIFLSADDLGLIPDPVRPGPFGLPAFPTADDLDALDLSHDCNFNGIPDSLDVAYGSSPDVNGDFLPDECDCNLNGRLDAIDLADGTSSDCNANTHPDECDISFGISMDCNTNIIPDECELDTDGDSLIDACDPDIDNDGRPNSGDVDPFDPSVCGDSDSDTCDDCTVGLDGFGPLPDHDALNDGPDLDGDGLCDLGDSDDDNDGVADAADTDPANPDICEDTDADGCDDCSVGTDDFGPASDADALNDGADLDGDGLCDATDADLDNDGVLNGSDTDPLDPTVCEDIDADTCDDCSVGTDGFGPLADNDPFNDGPDSNSDGICDAVSTGCPGGSAAECGDISPTDGVRDSACEWYSCAPTPTCNIIPTIFADMGGAFGACPPDGFCNIHDKNHALNCFAGTSGCDSLNVDAGGAFGACTPDGFCNIHDANHALTCFAGTNTCTCGPAPQGPAGEIVDETTLDVVASTALASADDRVAVRVFIADALANLQAYQLELEVSGGRRGHLHLEAIVIEGRRDAVFSAQAGTFDASNVTTAQVLRGLEFGGVTTPADGYLATFYYRPSADAAGTFVIDVSHSDESAHTYLVSDFKDAVEITGTTPATIIVGPDKSHSQVVGQAIKPAR
jgi:hypothetical protein